MVSRFQDPPMMILISQSSSSPQSPLPFTVSFTCSCLTQSEDPPSLRTHLHVSFFPAHDHHHSIVLTFLHISNFSNRLSSSSQTGADKSHSFWQLFLLIPLILSWYCQEFSCWKLWFYPEPVDNSSCWRLNLFKKLGRQINMQGSIPWNNIDKSVANNYINKTLKNCSTLHLQK